MNEASGIVPAPAIIPPPMRAFLSRRNGPSPDQIIPSFDETVRYAKLWNLKLYWVGN